MTRNAVWIRCLSVVVICGAPALVAAQQARLDLPFTDGEVLRAASLRQLRDAVNTLIGRVNEVEQSVTTDWGAIQAAVVFNGENTTKSVTVPGPGFLFARARGGNFNAVGINISIAGSVLGRAENGGTAYLPVTASDVVTVTTSGLGTNTGVDVFFRPLVNEP